MLDFFRCLCLLFIIPLLKSISDLKRLGRLLAQLGKDLLEVEGRVQQVALLAQIKDAASHYLLVGWISGMCVNNIIPCSLFDKVAVFWLDQTCGYHIHDIGKLAFELSYGLVI
jgi:hypothetical protein